MKRRARNPVVLIVLFAVGLFATSAVAEDGYDLWLRHAPLQGDALERARGLVSGVYLPGASTPMAASAAAELRRGLGAMLDAPVPALDSAVDGAVVLATPESWPSLAALDLPLAGLGEEGYLLRRIQRDGATLTLVVGNTERGLLYGAFALLRHQAGNGLLDALDTRSTPAIDWRVLNHWDNLDGHVERGYAGRSIWDWWRLPGQTEQRYVDYARANASLGINGTVLNNVNASALVLTERYLEKVAAIADVLRPWGIRVFLSARFSAPRDIGGLETADPLDPAVRAWWKAKADEIYRHVPDFGGFLVKANSEGQPGPQNYGRTHADGANLLAEALAPHGGVVFWRAFVYSETDPEDRVKQAYSEFKPLDGQFADNVLVQVKNGPLDFQPREPFHPMFGAMPATPLAMEFQLTQEYLGFATHLVYLGTMWEEVLDADTFAAGPGTTVAKVVDGRAQGHALTGIAGVANIGSDRDWSGHPFAQANWYAFGRLAWDPELGARDIAEEWLAQTFSRDDRFIEAGADLMMGSREAAVNYMTPLGLTHIMGTGHHYGPAPWVNELGRPEWNPYYYHRADTAAIGFDRTATGSDAVAQYLPPLAERYGDLATTPEEYLLWFHRLSWDHPVGDATLWEALVARYDLGVTQVRRMQAEWAKLGTYVDEERHARVARFLEIQLREAQWWRDACLAYFSEASGRPLPEGTAPPQHSLEHYRSLEFPFAPGNG